MKKFTVLFFCSLLFLGGCSGSDTYRGSWKAMNADGEKFTITFEPKFFAIKDSDGQNKSYAYTQKSYEMSNSVETYGIALEDGRVYKIHFPKANDTNIGIIKDDNDKAVYSIARKNYVTYDDIYKLD